VLGLVAGAMLVSMLYLWVTPTNPPGFYRDEAAIALNASTIADSGRDEFGARFPLYFESFEDWKSPLYVYVLAGVFTVTGPSDTVARATSGVLMLAAVLLLGLLAYRLTRSGVVAAAVVALASLNPWLYEVSRLVFDVTALPLLIVLYLLAVQRVADRPRWAIGDGVLIGLPLMLILFAYAGGRLLAVLFAAGLLVFVRRARVPGLVAAYAVLGVGLGTLASYAARHPGALTARAESVSFFGDEPLGDALWHATRNYVTDANPIWWLSQGDANPRHHILGPPGLLVPFVVAAVAGLVIVLVRRRGESWWQFVIATTLAAPIPAAITYDRHHSLRLVALPVLMAVLAIPAAEEAIRATSRRGRTAAIAVAGVLGVVLVVQFALFLDTYHDDGPGLPRRQAFEADVVPMLASVLSVPGGHIYLDYDDRRAQAQARWFAATRGLEDSVTILPDGGVPPFRSYMFLRGQTCDFPCEFVQQAFDYRLERSLVR
jgi:hypothetical protein